MSSKHTMIAITTSWNNQASFRLIPTELECPYNEVIYDPESKTLAIISKDKKDTFQMLPKLDPNGEIQPLRKVPASGRKIAEERKMLQTYYEYYITEKSEMVEFIKHFASNHETFNYSEILG